MTRSETLRASDADSEGLVFGALLGKIAVVGQWGEFPS